MPTTNNRKNLKAQIDLLSDEHQQITFKACQITNSLSLLEERIVAKSGASYAAQKTIQYFIELDKYLESQEDRIPRVRAEIEQIRKNINIPDIYYSLNKGEE